jgi:F-type H+-transporting ATPase subunit epsilon
VLMSLKILLPYGVFTAQGEVARIVAQTREGSLGLLPRRLDCIASLVPGILVYQRDGQPETYAALDEGVLVKAGSQVLISVRNAVAGADLLQLRAAVNDDFRKLDADEQQLRAELTRIETGFVSRVSLRPCRSSCRSRYCWR